jgi:hypothetical protein
MDTSGLWSAEEMKTRLDVSAMTFVQIALDDCDYAQTIAHLLSDGEHWAYIVDVPQLAMDGVIFVDSAHFKELAPEGRARCVVFRPDADTQTSDIWNTGVRHVVFASDPPSVARLAILAAELRLINTNKGLIARSCRFKKMLRTL